MLHALVNETFRYTQSEQFKNHLTKFDPSFGAELTRCFLTAILKYFDDIVKEYIFELLITVI